jgi:hypothetical protein
MRRYGLYDATRGLTLALAAGLAGLLLYLAAEVGQQSTVRFWEEMGIVAAAGLVLALAPVLGGWTSGLRLRFSPGTFLLGFVPVLVVVGWVLMATQPGNGWHEGRIVSWSHDLGLMGVIHSLGLWHGVLAFGFGLVLGTTLDSVPAPVPVPVEEPVVEPAPAATAAPVRDETLVADRRGPWWRRRRTAPAYADSAAADEPLTAEQVEAGRTEAEQAEAAHNAQPHTVTVGPAGEERTD